jgi:vacuolar-type H+-ATPase subunit I/STV1
MSVKDKIIFGLLAVLIVAGGYFQYMSSNMIKRMDELNKNDAEHVDVVQNEFRKDLKTLDLQFIGRGKHVQKAQQDIIANTNLINATADSLADMISEVQYNLDELDRNVSKRFSDVEMDIADLEDDFNRNRRKTSQTLSEIQQAITLLQTETNEIKDKISEKDKKKKK